MNPEKIATDQLKLSRTIEVYREIAANLTRALYEIKKIAPSLTVDEFLTFCSQHISTVSMGRGGERLLSGLKQVYAESHSHDHPGQDIARLIELKIVKLPNLQAANEAVHSALHSILKLKNEGTSPRERLFFFYPLINMFDGREFDVPGNLITKAEVFFSRYITNELQKEAFESFNVIASEMNTLIERGLLNPHHFTEDIFKGLGEAFKKADGRLVVSENAFWFFDKLGSGRIAPKVSFEDMFSVEPE